MGVPKIAMGDKVLFLDRDGVINEAKVIHGKPYPPSCVDDVIIPSGLQELLKDIKASGYKLIVVTNQPDVARGKQTMQTAEEINNYLKLRLDLDDVRTCYHDDSDKCFCRKPNPGLLLMSKGDVDFNASYLVGDRKKDIDTGINVGCKTIFIDHGYDEIKPTNSDYVIKSILQIGRILGV